MNAGVSKSGSPIPRWTMLRPCASRERPRASMSNEAEFVSRLIRSADLMLAFLPGPGRVLGEAGPPGPLHRPRRRFRRTGPAGGADDREPDLACGERQPQL